MLIVVRPVPAAGPNLPAAGVAAIPSPPRKTRKTSHQKQKVRQNERKRRAVQGQGQAHGRQSRYAAQIGPANPVKKSTIPQSTVWYLFG